jgi:hypothetical protein
MLRSVPRRSATIRKIVAIGASASQLSWSKMPYSATPARGGLGRAAPAADDHRRTPMFHGPKGMLAPMPARISHASVPRTSDSPAMSAEKTAPVTTQASTPKAATRRISCAVSPWKAAITSA